MRIALATLITLSALAVPAHARPTLSERQARSVIHYFYGPVAEAADGHVKILDCRRSGYKRSCHVRLTGDAPQELRVMVWSTKDGDDFWLSATNWRHS